MEADELNAAASELRVRYQFHPRCGTAMLAAGRACMALPPPLEVLPHVGDLVSFAKLGMVFRVRQRDFTANRRIALG